MSMSMNERFKTLESDFRNVLPSKQIYAIRMDGRAFHTFTKQYKAPYDEKFMENMNAAAQTAISEVFPGALIAYVQSDEISVIFTDKTSKDAQLPFAGKLEKLLTVSASATTAGFMRNDPNVDGLPLFDARITAMDDLGDVLEYITWRRLDARKNAVSMAASALYSDAELHGVSTSERASKLVGTPYERLPEGFFNGRLIVKKTRKEEVTYTDKRTQKENTILADVSKWEVMAATQSATNYEVAQLLNRFE